eukprot:TRINITY_DN11774_c0_g2_i2.p1 TRINITY_DN11774_c0_g2~~TRINITY_DN11774_c0_g2_i2.p1  ORF type:complete len:859 (-),score=104.30 TRINITY_DN11774_c0_g2_i2:105-2681(-)
MRHVIASLTFVCFAYFHSAKASRSQPDLLRSQSTGISFAAQSSTRWGECGYGKDDILNLSQSVVRKSVFDPRVGIRQGFLRGIAAKTVQFARALTDSHVIPLELSGWLAIRVVQAQYGIVTTHVPKACFAKMVHQLQNANRTWKAIKERRARLREILDELPTACSLGNNSSEVGSSSNSIGKSAKKQLSALKWGYWSLYEPLTDNKTFVISAQVLDEYRYNKHKTKPRQIWHYGKLFLYRELDEIMRKQYLTSKSQGMTKSEKGRLKLQRRRLTRLLTLMDARLEYVELDNMGNCVSASSEGPLHILQQIANRKSSVFRCTLFFRERSWQRLAKKIVHGVHHPIVTVRKKQNRLMDEWYRSLLGHRLVMILSPIAKVAAISGLVLGTLTGGAFSLVTLFTAAFWNSGMAMQAMSLAVSANTLKTTILFLLGKLIEMPISDMQGEMMNWIASRLEGSTAMNRFYSMFEGDDDFKDVVWDTNVKLQTLIEHIMETEAVASELKQIDDDESRGDMEATVRVYVEMLVRSSFIDEVAPLLEENIESEIWRHDPNFGWLPWRRWRIHRKDKDARALQGKLIRYSGHGQNWTANVSSVRAKSMFKFGRDSRKLMVRYVGDDPKLSPNYEIPLTRDLKAQLSVFDPDAYRYSMSGWLTWHDWAEYRRGTSARFLEKKDIFINTDFPGCTALQGSCLRAIQKDDGVGFAVTRVSWKTTWLGSRTVFVDVDGSSQHPCQKEGFSLTPEVKACLLVRDAVAYKKSLLDTHRRKLDKKWTEGQLNASVSISQEVVQAMQQYGQGKLTSEAKAANDILESRCGVMSVQLEQQELSGNEAPHDEIDPELQAVEDEIERSFIHGSLQSTKQQ